MPLIRARALFPFQPQFSIKEVIRATKQSDEETKWKLPRSRRLKRLYFRSEQPGEVHYVGLVIGIKEVAIMARWRTWFSISLQSSVELDGVFFPQKKGLRDSSSFTDGEKVQSQKNASRGKCNISLVVAKRHQTWRVSASFLYVTISTGAVFSVARLENATWMMKTVTY